MKTLASIARYYGFEGFIQNRQINFLIKFGVLLLVGYVFYQQIWARENIGDITAIFWESLNIETSYWFVLTLLLMPINWALETLKWQGLIKGFEVISFWKAYKAIFAGITCSIFTPNRIGEYGGRILLVKPENNWKAVIATAVGSFSQLLVLVTIGIVGFLYFVAYCLELDLFTIRGMAFIGILLTTTMLFCFYNIRLIIPFLYQLPFAKYIQPVIKNIEVLEQYESKALSQALSFALARYIVYSLQYYFLLQFFGIEIPLLAGLAGIATIFLFQTSIPLPPIFGLLVRGELALYVWSFFTVNQMGILGATFSLWIINLIVPALIGMIFIININVLKSLGYENESS